MMNNKRTARMTGMLYLLVIICAGFSQGVVRESLIVSGDASSTYHNILQSQGLFRLGLVTDLVAFLIDAVISILLYQLLKPVSKTISLISSAFRLLAHPAIGSLNLLNHFMALWLVDGNSHSLSVEQLQEWTLFFTQAHHYGYLIAGAFFGAHCFLLGWLLYRSNQFPGVFGVLMILAAFGYLIESFGVFLFPGNDHLFAMIVGVTAAVGEVSLTGFLLIKGVRPDTETILKYKSHE